MVRTLLIDDGLFETRAALLEDEQLQEIRIERPDQTSRVGDFHLGRIATIVTDLDAAFVDIGNKETGFLKARDIARKNEGIASLVHEGQKILVQVLKDPLDDKGLQLGCHFQLETPYLIFQPRGKGLTLSKRITAKKDRDRLRAALEEYAQSGALIIRTAACTATDAVLKSDISRLLQAWRDIEEAHGNTTKPRRLSPEQSPLIRLLTDLYQPDMEIQLTPFSAQAGVKSYLEQNFPADPPKMTLWSGTHSLFEEFGIEAEIDRALEKTVTLEEGVSITLEPTEAMVVIDVNSGGLTRRKGQVSVALGANLIAASEIARQIRLRNYSGIIIIDFIQMSGPGEVKQLQKHMKMRLDKDPIQTRLIGMTELGLMQITRQRTRRSLHSLFTAPCLNCQGTGYQDSLIAILSKLVRSLEIHGRHATASEIKIKAGAELTEALNAQQSRIENHLAKRLLVQEDAGLPALAFLIE